MVVAVLLLTIFLVILINWLLFLYRRPPGLPPGPLPIPFLGSAYVFLGRDASKVFTQLRQSYGGAATIFAGCSMNGLIVILLDWDTVTELANNPNVSDRPLQLNELRGVSEGILWAQYNRAKKRRKFLTQAFKKMGMAPMLTATPPHVVDEITRLVSYIDGKRNQPFDPNDVVTEAMTSCLLLKMYNRRFDLKDEICAKLFAGGRLFFEATLFAMLMLPQLTFLRYFVRDKMAEGEQYMEKVMAQWLRDEIAKRQSLPSDDRQLEDGFDLIEAYMTEDGESTFEDFRSFVRSLVDVFLGSMDTNSKTMCWTIFYLAHLPDEQDRLFKEIESVVPSTNYPQIEHRNHLNRLLAFMEESARYSCMAMVGFARRCDQSVTFNSTTNKGKKVAYNIPENASVWFQWFTSQFDNEYWLDPQNFRVDRWLNPVDGRFEARTHSLPFSIGRRVCIGEQVARNLQFLFLASLIQQFKWRLDEYVPLENYRLGLTRIPPCHKIVFTRRD